MGGSTSVSAPDPTATANNADVALGSQLSSIFGNTSQYAPQLGSLMGNMTQQALLGGGGQQGLVSTYGQAAQGLQGSQGALNTQQAGQNIGLINQYAPSAINALQQADPALTQIQSQLSNYATNYLNPESMSSSQQYAPGYAAQLQQGLGQYGITAPQIQSSAGTLNGFAPNVQQINPTSVTAGSIGNVQNVNAPQNQTLNQLNQTAQQQLAMGTSVTPQEQATVANQVLSNYNSMGRANDPTAIAGLATGLDTYGQQLLGTREAAAQTAAGLTTSQGQLGLSAQQSNQAANLSAAQSNLGAYQQSALANQSTNLAAGQSNQSAALAGSGLNLSALTTQAGLQQQAALANQQASLTAQGSNLSAYLNAMGLTGNALSSQNTQNLTSQFANQQAGLANLNAQSGLMGQAASLDQSIANPALSMLMTPSQGLSSAYSATGQAAGIASGGQSLDTQFNPLTNGMYSTDYAGQLQAGVTNATTAAGQEGGLMSLFGSLGSAGLGYLGASGMAAAIGGAGTAGAAGAGISASDLALIALAA